MSRDAIEIEEQTGCRVVAGSWRSHYDGVVVERSQELEVDHLVSLKEAWDSGAWSWTRDQRSAFANDLQDGRGLRAVTIAPLPRIDPRATRILRTGCRPIDEPSAAISRTGWL
jgi:hypothetical protein